MIVFIAVAASLIAASLLFVLVPLWRARRPTTGKRREANITVYQQRCDEIEREVAAQRISRDDADVAKDELGARLLADIDAAPAAGAVVGASRARIARRPWLASLLTLVLLTAGSVAIYWQTGDFQAIKQADMPDIGTMIGRLQKAVKQSPNDVRARALLAQAQQASGAYAAAADNYAAINAALPKPRASVLAAQAETTLQATDNLQGQARALFQRLLSLDGKSRAALWYLGLAAAERGDDARAEDYWSQLLEQDLPADFAGTVRNRRNELSGNKPTLSGQ